MESPFQPPMLGSTSSPYQRHRQPWQRQQHEEQPPTHIPPHTGAWQRPQQHQHHQQHQQQQQQASPIINQHTHSPSSPMMMRVVHSPPLPLPPPPSSRMRAPPAPSSPSILPPQPANAFSPGPSVCASSTASHVYRRSGSGGIGSGSGCGYSPQQQQPAIASPMPSLSLTARAPNALLADDNGTRRSSWLRRLGTMALLTAVLLGAFFAITEPPLQALPAGEGSSEGHIWSNVFQRQGCSPVAFYQPRTEEQIIRIVRKATRAREKIKMVGAGLSFVPELVCGPDDEGVNLLSLDHYSRLLVIDADSSLVTVQAGIRLHNLLGELERRGLTLPLLSDIMWQSVAGALSTGTHGSSPKLGSLGSLVERLTLIDSKGRVLSASRDENEDIFLAAGLGLGVSGVLSTVTLRCEPLVWVRCTERLWPGPELLLNHTAGMLERNDFFGFRWLPQTDLVATQEIQRLSRADGSTQSELLRLQQQQNASWVSWCQELFRRTIAVRLVNLGLRLEVALPWLSPWFQPLLWPMPSADDTWTTTALLGNALSQPHPGWPSFQQEVSIPVEFLRPAFLELREMIKQEMAAGQLNYNSVVTVRFAAGDPFWLSPFFERPQSACLGLSLYFQGEVHGLRLGERVTRLMAKFGARPHWGQYFDVSYYDETHCKELFPKLEDFKVARLKLDSDGTFVTAAGSRLFRDSAEHVRRRQAESQKPQLQQLQREEKEEEQAKEEGGKEDRRKTRLRPHKQAQELDDSDDGSNTVEAKHSSDHASSPAQQQQQQQQEQQENERREKQAIKSVEEKQKKRLEQDRPKQKQPEQQEQEPPEPKQPEEKREPEKPDTEEKGKGHKDAHSQNDQNFIRQQQEAAQEEQDKAAEREQLRQATQRKREEKAKQKLREEESVKHSHQDQTKQRAHEEVPAKQAAPEIPAVREDHGATKYESGVESANETQEERRSEPEGHGDEALMKRIDESLHKSAQRLATAQAQLQKESIKFKGEGVHSDVTL